MGGRFDAHKICHNFRLSAGLSSFGLCMYDVIFLYICCVFNVQVCSLGFLFVFFNKIIYRCNCSEFPFWFSSFVVVVVLKGTLVFCCCFFLSIFFSKTVLFSV